MKSTASEIVVPDKWIGARYEYKIGYYHGQRVARKEIKLMRNPVSHRSPDGIFRRDAWAAGYTAGKKNET